MFLGRVGLSRVGARTVFDRLPLASQKPAFSLLKPIPQPIQTYPKPPSMRYFSTPGPTRFHTQTPLCRFRDPFNQFQYQYMGPRSRFSPVMQLGKIIFGIIIFTSFFVFVAAPLLFVVLPIIIVLSVLYYRVKTKGTQLLVSRQLTKLAGTGLKYRNRNEPLVTILEDVKFQNFVKNRVKIFIEDSEQGNTLADRVRNINNITISPIYSRIYQQWVINDNEEQLLTILNTELYELDKRLLNLIISLKQIDLENFDVIIEIKIGLFKYLINEGSIWDNTNDGDGFIDIKDYNVHNL